MRKSQRVKENGDFGKQVLVIREALLSLTDYERLIILMGAVKLDWISLPSQTMLQRTIRQRIQSEISFLNPKKTASKVGGAV